MRGQLRAAAYVPAVHCWYCGLPAEAWPIPPLRLPDVPPERYCCYLHAERAQSNAPVLVAPTLAR